jgi:hypothetical protein
MQRPRRHEDHPPASASRGGKGSGSSNRAGPSRGRRRTPCRRTRRAAARGRHGTARTNARNRRGPANAAKIAVRRRVAHSGSRAAAWRSRMSSISRSSSDVSSRAGVPSSLSKIAARNDAARADDPRCGRPSSSSGTANSTQQGKRRNARPRFYQTRRGPAKALFPKLCTTTNNLAATSAATAPYPSLHVFRKTNRDRPCSRRRSAASGWLPLGVGAGRADRIRVRDSRGRDSMLHMRMETSIDVSDAKSPAGCSGHGRRHCDIPRWASRTKPGGTRAALRPVPLTRRRYLSKQGSTSRADQVITTTSSTSP